MSDTMRDDHELRPERVSLPSFCCVRHCDKEATVMDYGEGSERLTLRPGASLLIYAFCPDHAETEVPGG